MREILFRGKREDTGEWVYGYYTEACGTYDVGISVIETKIDDYVVIPETVGQYTGRKDRNGTKIFEGDIVKTEFGRLCIIVWFSSRVACGWDLESIRTSENLLHDAPRGIRLFNEDYLDVVGNIHDNPELLTEN